jgi:hypothetical protein
LKSFEGTRTTIVPFSAPSWRVGRNHVEKLCGFTRLSMRSNILSQAVMPAKIPQKRGKQGEWLFPQMWKSCGN